MLQEEPNPIMSATDLWKLVEINPPLLRQWLRVCGARRIRIPRHLWLVREGGYNTVTGRYAKHCVSERPRLCGTRQRSARECPALPEHVPQIGRTLGASYPTICHRDAFAQPYTESARP